MAAAYDAPMLARPVRTIRPAGADTFADLRAGPLRVAPGFVRRPALVRRLAEARDAALVLFVAPPGYGKSTLLAEWAQSDDRTFLWPGPELDPDGLIELVREAQHRHSGIVVVLDDADHRSPELVSDGVAAAVTELGPRSTIAMASRADTSLPLGRLRAHGLLAEVRIGDFAMSEVEGGTLLRRQGIELPLDDVRTLVERTEGWPAALHLAALFLHDAPGDVASFAGHLHVVFEYLSEEVLESLPPDLRRFAVRVSVLDELSGPLCVEVTEQPSATAMLHQLARADPLLIPVDAGHRAYRWHNLVRDALRAELQRTEPEMERRLQRRASAWYSEAGQMSRAIDYAAAAGDAERTGDLLSDQALAYVTSGRSRQVDGWLNALGRDRVAEYAPLALAASLSCLTAGDAGGAHRWSIAAGAALKRGQVGHSRRSLTTGLAVVDAVVGAGAATSMGTLALRAADAAPEEIQWQPFCLLLEGISSYLKGDRSAADRVLEEGIKRSGDTAPSLTGMCLAQRAMIAIEQSDWDLAAEMSDAAASMVSRWGLESEPISAIVFAAGAASRAHDGRVDEAKLDLRRGIDLLATLGPFVPWYGAEARILLAHASLCLADVVGARTLLSAASRLARKTPDAVIFTHWFDQAWASMDAIAETRLAGPSALTIAELRILRFLPTHRSFREIATLLGVSANTVKTQAHAVYRKLGAASRSEAVDRAIDAGLLGQ